MRGRSENSGRGSELELFRFSEQLTRQSLPRQRPESTSTVTSATSSSPAELAAEAAAASSRSWIVTWRVLRKHWGTALATALAVSLSVTFFTLGQTKIYQATSTIEFDPNPPRPLGKEVEAVVDMGPGTYWDHQEYYQTQLKIIQSMGIALWTVRELSLDQDAAFLRNLPPGSHPSAMKVTPEEAADILRARLSIAPVKESRLAVVQYEDADPHRAQTILSTLVDRYIEHNLEDAVASTNSAAEWLRTQLDKLKTDLESNEMALHEYKLSKNILSVAYDDQSNMLREEVKQLNDVLTGIRAKRQEIAARRNQLAKVNGDDPSDLPASELLQSTQLQLLRQHYEQATRDRDALLGLGKGSSHPDVQAETARLNATRSALLAEIRNIQGALDRDLATVKEQEGGVAGLLEAAKKQALDLNLLEIEYNRLHRSKDNTEKLYQLVLERTKESDLTRVLRVNNIRMIDRPLLPRGPLRPKVPVNIAIGIAAGLALGMMAALGRGLMDRTLRTPEDVERELGLPFLGLLPEINDGSTKAAYYGGRKRHRHTQHPISCRELIVHEHPTSGVAEASRSIRTNLTFTSPDHPYRTLLVTSAGPLEGKTTVACCIATAMAQAGQKVVLVDCDLRRPRLHRVFGKASDVGVTTGLLEGTLERAALPTSVPNLSVIPAGPLPPNPAEIVQSERFRTALRRLSEQFDRVIIDSPPIVPVTDAAILSTLVDGVVLIVKGYTTRKDLARMAVRALADVGGKTAGVVLNAINLDRHEYKYSYYYYYKREGYYSATGTPTGHATPAALPPDADVGSPN